MVSSGLEGIGQLMEDGFSVMMDHGRFSVHQPVGPDHFAAESHGERLVHGKTSMFRNGVFDHGKMLGERLGVRGKGKESKNVTALRFPLAAYPPTRIYSFKKFRSKSLPAAVRMDSG